jgi:hypothetical protein
MATRYSAGANDGFAAAWSISNLSEPETSAASRYTFEVGCFAIKEAGEQAAAASV